MLSNRGTPWDVQPVHVCPVPPILALHAPLLAPEAPVPSHEDAFRVCVSLSVTMGVIMGENGTSHLMWMSPN